MTTRPKGSVINLQNINGVISLNDIGVQNVDITTAFVAALISGVPIFIPAGTWVISGISLPANAVLFGVGPSSILKLKDTANTTALTLGNNNILYEFNLDCNKNNQVGSGFNGIDFSNSTRSRIRNITVMNPKGSGMYFGGTNAENDVVNCSITGYTENGIKVVAATDLGIYNASIYSSDAAATGDGIALVSAGLNVTGLVIDAPKIKDVTNRGISCIGSGTRTVTDVSISNPRVINATSHAIHMLLAESVTVSGGMLKNCGGDGIRLEGDVQRCMATGVIVRSNLGTAIREVVNGVTPNYNNLTYNQLINNTVNTSTKLGANSVVV